MKFIIEEIIGIVSRHKKNTSKALNRGFQGVIIHEAWGI